MLLAAAVTLTIAASGLVRLPPGTIDISTEIVVPEGARDLTIQGAAEGTLLRAAPDFRGRALVVARGARGLRFRSLALDGNRAALETRAGLPPYDTPFVRFTRNNGLQVEDSEDVVIEDLEARQIAGFAVLVARSARVEIRRARVSASGSRNAAGRNNTTGGVLLEEGVAGFRVLDCAFEDVRGNGVWTHSLYTSPRNRDGVIARNRFAGIGRDAIQVGHATRIRVEEKTGTRIGYPAEEVDADPVAIDTAGNVDSSAYLRNRFEEINGKCIDLDGFHHGEVRGNSCLIGHYGIVMNNSNPDMRPEGVIISGNLVRGMKYGGVFVIGTDNRIEDNRLLDLNTAGCDGNCTHFEGEPDLLQSGIYLGRRAERPAVARRNVIRGNTITGHRMAERCIGAAPGVSLKENTVAGNVCRDGP